MADNINFDELENQARDNIEKKNKELKLKIEQENTKKGLTEGWTKGPWIVGGVIAAAMILVSLYIVFIM